MWGHSSRLEHLHVRHLLAAGCLPSQPRDLQLQPCWSHFGSALGRPHMGAVGPSLVQRPLTRDLQLRHCQGEAAFLELSSVMRHVPGKQELERWTQAAPC